MVAAHLLTSAFSNAINQSRLRVLRAREELLAKIVADAAKQLANMSKNPEDYKKLLRDLILQVSSVPSNSPIIFGELWACWSTLRGQRSDLLSCRVSSSCRRRRCRCAAARQTKLWSRPLSPRP